MTLDDFRLRLNEWGRGRVPFLFVVDFELQHPQAWRVDELPLSILFDFNGHGNGLSSNSGAPPILPVSPISFQTFRARYDQVLTHLNRGDSFLTNLTISSPVKSTLDLKALFYQAKARYKMWLENQFLFFSPETFVQIADEVISTYPMKGTIDAGIPDALKKILSDPKELAEHITIVDLLRNDLGLVSADVEVKRFRYVEEIKTPGKSIFQVSSEISGRLTGDYWSRLGDIFIPLLPAGSVSGAPKKKTLEIIRDAEQEPRGYYTGVAGYFDGDRLDSCVMIRFIEQNKNQFYYRSGAGITSQSKPETEYQELLDKIYVPLS